VVGPAGLADPVDAVALADVAALGDPGGPADPGDLAVLVPWMVRPTPMAPATMRTRPELTAASAPLERAADARAVCLPLTPMAKS
jgi:hypothetical protein